MARRASETATPEIGQRVRVVGREDESMLLESVGAEGRVVEVLHEHGCGEVPGDPMVVVELDDGRRDGFWREELSPLDREHAAVPSGAGA